MSQDDGRVNSGDIKPEEWHLRQVNGVQQEVHRA